MNLLEQALGGTSLIFPRSRLKPTVPHGQKDHIFYRETLFSRMLKVERMRTERSKKPFLLLLLDISRLLLQYPRGETLADIKSALLPSLREIDILGWYHTHQTIGIIITELAAQNDLVDLVLVKKIYERFCKRLDPDWIDKIKFSFHLFPETNGSSSGNTFNDNLYPDVARQNAKKTFSLAAKKAIDIVGSGLALICFSPLFLIIAAAVKATSPGPVFFKQARVGLNGKTFTMLKFRSMKTNCDSVHHQNYIKKYIRDQNNAAAEPGIFKLTRDPRITPIGGFLRKTSLDELPQFINVFKGDMSLVGPRPPIAYECELYDIWHRRRLLSCKPGITGLWQVMGRSRTTFDEMVRLDLKYIREWDLLLDIKILFMTPRAVISGSGAL